MLSFVEIDDSFTVSSSPEPVSFSPDIDAQVDAVWARAIEQHPGLFDGAVLRVVSCDEKFLHCAPISYRYFYAQQTEHSLRDALQLVCVGVSGLVTMDDQVLVGTRSAFVTQCPNLFELVPSGSLPAPTPKDTTDAIDYRQQLLIELHEETGIPKESVEKIAPFLLVRDETDAVVDVCCSVGLKNLDMQDLLQGSRSDEYAELALISWQQLRSMVKTAPELWVATSALMVQRSGNWR